MVKIKEILDLEHDEVKGLEKLRDVQDLRLIAPTRRAPIINHQLLEDNGKVNFEIPKNTIKNIEKYSQELNIEAKFIFLSAWMILLYRYSGERKFIVGCGMEEKNDDHVSLPLLIEVEKVMTGNQMVEMLYEHFNKKPNISSQLYKNQEQFEKIKFQAGFFWGKPNNTLEKRIASIEEILYQIEMPIELNIFFSNTEQFEGCINYKCSQFEEIIFQRMVKNYLDLLEQLVRNPVTPVSELKYINREELDQILVQWNETKTSYPAECTIAELFEEQVKRDPEATAVVFEGNVLSYAELNERANQAAAYLRKQGVSEGDLVGISMERSAELIVGLLAVLKAGGAYVPLDPSYPKERLNLMIEDTELSIILTQEHLREELWLHEDHLQLIIFNSSTEEFAAENKENLAPMSSSDSLAYVVFTSGSTGKPKGVAVPQRGVVRLVKETNYVTFGPDEVMMLLAPVAFDASTLEIWGALLNGGKLAVFPAHRPSLEEIGRFVEQEGITSLWLTA
ncbi:hypothetical protein BSK54_15890, partial [Paenibacillus odorifer]